MGKYVLLSRFNLGPLDSIAAMANATKIPTTSDTKGNVTLFRASGYASLNPNCSFLSESDHSFL